MPKTPLVLPLPKPVVDLGRAQQALRAHYADNGLKFTLDGRLVGDIAEALALEHFGLRIPAKRTKGVDALTVSGETVQIKATGLENSGPAFTPGTGVARYLLFFRIDFVSGVATLLYNGLEEPVRARLLPSTPWTGTKVVRLSGLRALQEELGDSDALPLKKGAGVR